MLSVGNLIVREESVVATVFTTMGSRRCAAIYLRGDENPLLLEGEAADAWEYYWRQTKSENISIIDLVARYRTREAFRERGEIKLFKAAATSGGGAVSDVGK